MGRYFTTFKEGVRAAIAASWGTLPAYDMYQIQRAVLSNTLQDFGENFVALDLAEYPSDTRTGPVTAHTYAPQAEVYRFLKYTEGAIDEIEGLMEDLRTYLENNPLALGQRMDVWFSASAKLPVNRVLVSKRIPLICGLTTIQLTVGHIHRT